MLAQTELLRTQYLELREVTKKLCDKLMKSVGMSALEAGAKRLGLWRNGGIAIDSDTVGSVLIDYCIYDVPLNGRNTLETYLREHQADDDSLKSECLRRMQNAEYGIHLVESTEPQLGVHVRDVVRGTKRLLIDFGLANTVSSGMAIATRLIHFDAFSMSCGAPLVIPTGGRRDLRKMLLRTAERAGDSLDPANIIRPILEQGGGNRTVHVEAVEHLRHAPAR